MLPRAVVSLFLFPSGEYLRQLGVGNHGKMFKAACFISRSTLSWNIHQIVKVKNIAICGLNSIKSFRRTTGISAELNHNYSLLSRRSPPVNLRTTSSPKWEICHWSDSTGLVWPLTLGATCTDWTAALRSLMSCMQINEDVRKQQGDRRIPTWMNLLETKGILSHINSKTTDVHDVLLCFMRVSQWTPAVFLQLDTAACCTTMSDVVPISAPWKLLLPGTNSERPLQ